MQRAPCCPDVVTQRLTKKKEDTWRKPTPDAQAYYIGSNSGKSEGMNDSDRNEMIAAVVSKYPSSHLQNNFIQ